MKWYRKVFSSGTADDRDLSAVLDACDAYEVVYEESKGVLNVKGRIESISARIPGWSEQWYSQLQDLEAILQYMEQRERKTLIHKVQQIEATYNRKLTDKQMRDYAEVSDEVQAIRAVLHQVAYVRNLFIGLGKGLEYLHFQVGNVTKLRCAGLEDAVLDTRESYH